MSKERLIKHWDENKKFYLGIGIGLGAAGITALIVRSSSSRYAYSALSDAVMHIPPSQVTSHSFNSNSFNTTNISGAKRLSYIISQPGTENWWRSQGEAAKALGITAVNISRYFNHGEPIPGRPDLQLIREGISGMTGAPFA